MDECCSMKYILVTDDEILNQVILEESLNETYEVKCVDDGVSCLNSIEERTPDLLLLDLSMPGMGGMEVCRTLRDSKKTKELPIFILSGFDENEYKDALLELGVNKFISKPFSISTLRESVDSLMSEV